MVRSAFIILFTAVIGFAMAADSPGERISVDENWRFTRGDPTNNGVNLLYDVWQQQTIRPLAETESDGNAAVRESAASARLTNQPSAVIKQWILPTGNAFIKDRSRKFLRPEGNPGDGVAYGQPGFDDSAWQ